MQGELRAPTDLIGAGAWRLRPRRGEEAVAGGDEEAHGGPPLRKFAGRKRNILVMRLMYIFEVIRHTIPM
jgi:hypothetical protein